MFDKMVGKPNMNFINALSYIFYVSKLFGLIPYALSEYKQHKILQNSIFGNILSVLSLAGYVISYHFAVAKIYFDGKTFDSGKFRDNENNDLVVLQIVAAPNQIYFM